MLNILYTTKLPHCNSSKFFDYWDGKYSTLVSSSFRGGCPFFKDKEVKATEDLRRPHIEMRYYERNGMLDDRVWCSRP